jgi:hypothetical protein
MRHSIRVIHRKLIRKLYLYRLSRSFETWKLFTKADTLQRNLDAERISAWIQLNNDERNAINKRRERCLRVVFRRAHLLDLREAWERWWEHINLFRSRKRAARRIVLARRSLDRDSVRTAFSKWKVWSHRVEIQQLRHVLSKALEMAERQVSFANGMLPSGFGKREKLSYEYAPETSRKLMW